MSKKYYIKSNEFAIIINNKIEEKNTLSVKNLISAFRNVIQRYYGTDDREFYSWIKSFNDPIGYEKNARG